MSDLAAPDPDWPAKAQAEIDHWFAAAPNGLRHIHHIGSTSVPGLPAKPILDLMPIFEPGTCDAARPVLEQLGYEWCGDFGLPGRRYLRRDDPDSGQRLFQVHCYEAGHADIRRHLAFRDALRANAPLRVGYTSIKAHCAARHPGDPQGYGACKSDWIRRTEAKALEIYG